VSLAERLVVFAVDERADTQPDSPRARRLGYRNLLFVTHVMQSVDFIATPKDAFGRSHKVTKKNNSFYQRQYKIKFS
jgi:hypothetical protein